MRRFIRYLAEIEFVIWSSERGRALPEVNLSPAQMQAVEAVGGRGGVSKKIPIWESLVTLRCVPECFLLTIRIVTRGLVMHY